MRRSCRWRVVYWALAATAFAGDAYAGSKKDSALGRSFAIVAVAQQEVAIVRVGERLVARAGDVLLAGDEVHTGARGRAKIILADESVINVGDRTRARLLSSPVGSANVQVDEGILRVFLRSADAKSPHAVGATHGASAVTTGGDFIFRVGRDALEALTLAGEATLRGAGSIPLPPAMAARAIDETRVASRLEHDSIRRANVATTRLRGGVQLGSIKAATERKRKASQAADDKKPGDAASRAGAAGELDPLVPPGGAVRATGRVGRRH